jgi:hypothetical protein
VVVEKRVSVRWGSHVWQTRLMMKNEDAPHLFRISRRAPHKEAGAHMLRAGVGEKVQYS